MAEQDPGLVADGARRGRPGVVAVGLTGGVGAGKSTALAMFGELGALTASADQIVHDLYTQPAFVARMVGQFGPGILDPDGNIDRRRLAEMVKGRRDKLQWLERLTHPLVADEIERIISEAPAGAIVVCEVPLLFESHFEALFDLLVTIEARHEQRFSRSAHRFDRVVFDEFEALQASSDERVSGSHLAYFNDGSPDDMREFVRDAYARAVSLLEGSA